MAERGNTCSDEGEELVKLTQLFSSRSTGKCSWRCYVHFREKAFPVNKEFKALSMLELNHTFNLAPC